MKYSKHKMFEWPNNVTQFHYIAKVGDQVHVDLPND